jgi:hypothetical protein
VGVRRKRSAEQTIDLVVVADQSPTSVRDGPGPPTPRIRQGRNEVRFDGVTCHARLPFSCGSLDQVGDDHLPRMTPQTGLSDHLLGAKRLRVRRRSRPPRPSARPASSVRFSEARQRALPESAWPCSIILPNDCHRASSPLYPWSAEAYSPRASLSSAPAVRIEFSRFCPGVGSHLVDKLRGGIDVADSKQNAYHLRDPLEDEEWFSRLTGRGLIRAAGFDHERHRMGGIAASVDSESRWSSSVGGAPPW